MSSQRWLCVRVRAQGYLMRTSKYNYATVIQGYFDNYWEDVSEYAKGAMQIKKDLKEYRISSNHSYRVTNRRVLKVGE